MAGFVIVIAVGAVFTFAPVTRFRKSRLLAE
jgi:hypothetical protein